MTEASETLTQLPLDFSVTMMNIKIKSELNNNTSMFLSQNNQQSSSAFKVVTPRGKTDGEFSCFFYGVFPFLDEDVERKMKEKGNSMSFEGKIFVKEKEIKNCELKILQKSASFV